MEEGTLAKWLVKEGDTVKSGDILAEIETDKATMEFEAVDEGTIGKILVAEGTDDVKVGTVIATDRRRGRGRLPRRHRAAGRSRPQPKRRRPSRRPRADARAAARSRPARAQLFDAAEHDAEVAIPTIPAGTEMVKTDRARGAARRDGRGNAHATTASS